MEISQEGAKREFDIVQGRPTGAVLPAPLCSVKRYTKRLLRFVKEVICTRKTVFDYLYHETPLVSFMAKKVQRKSTCRRYEVVSGTNTNVGGVAAVWSTVSDVGAQLSRINHRLFRQGRQYRARVIADQNSFGDSSSYIEVYALAPTWYVNAAWRKAKAAYDLALKDEKKVLNEQNLARWRDFRVRSGITGFGGADLLENGGVEPQLHTMTTGATAPVPTPFTAGEFNFATAENLDTGLSMSFTWGSGSGDKFGILDEYTLTRNESASPQTVITTMPYDVLMAEGEDADYQELQANGNDPPYNADSFQSNIWVLVGCLSPGDLGSKSTGYFDAPCGIIVTRNSYHAGNPDFTDLGKVTIEVAEGDYHGVHAPAM